MNTEMEAELTEIRKQKEVLVQERNTLLDSLKRTNEEFILLKKKRIQDVSRQPVFIIHTFLYYDRFIFGFSLR